MTGNGPNEVNIPKGPLSLVNVRLWQWVRKEELTAVMTGWSHCYLPSLRSLLQFIAATTVVVNQRRCSSLYTDTLATGPHRHCHKHKNRSHPIFAAIKNPACNNSGKPIMSNMQKWLLFPHLLFHNKILPLFHIIYRIINIYSNFLHSRDS